MEVAPAAGDVVAPAPGAVVAPGTTFVVAAPDDPGIELPALHATSDASASKITVPRFAMRETT